MKKAAIGLLCLLLGIVAFAQPRTTAGTVMDENEAPLAGATVVSGSSYTVTDADGRYSLDAGNGAQVTVSFLGYDDYVYTVSASSSTILIKMNPSAATMLEESVAIGYGKTTKKEVTGSVASLKADDLDKGAFTSAAGMLQGKVAGLTVNNPDGGDPNASFELLLRGTGTLKSGQGPLIIIDGVVDADIRSINFQEVESIDVLKDGSAAAIYGTRGSNGVVIITTKRARSGKTSVEYDGQVSVQTVAARAKPMTAQEFTSTIQQYAPASSGSLYGAETDWFKEVTRIPVSHKHSLAVSGGNEKFSHRTVLNVEQNQGLLKKNDVQKYLFKTNIHQEALEGWLTLDYNLSYSKRKYASANYSIFRQAFIHNPTEPVYSDKDKDAGGYQRIVAMDYYNPVAMLNERESDNDIDNIGANLRATLNIVPVPGLKWDNFFSYNGERYESREYKTRYYPSSIGDRGHAEISNSKYSNMQWESTLQYSHQFGAHSIQAIAGYTWQQTDDRSSYMENYDFDSDQYKTDNISSGYALKDGLAGMSSYRSRSRYIAFFARVMYNYAEKYLISLSVREDGSTRFGANNKWATFPAVSLGWRISQENWLKDVSWLDELKLRAGFGMTGNQDFSNYKSLLLMSPSGHYYSNGRWINSYAPSSNANPDLRWERKSEVNAGLDFSFLDGRLSGSIDYYYRYTSDLLYDYNVPVPPYDYKTLFTNVGAISNQGVELTLNAIPVKAGAFQWNTTLTMAHNTNRLVALTNEEFKDTDYKVGSIGDPINEDIQRLEEKQSLGTFYGPVWEGIDPDGSDHLKGEFSGKVPYSKWEAIGNAFPILTMGWSNNLRYGNLSLGMTFRASIGGKVYNTYRATYENLTGIGLRNILSSWLDDPSFTGKPAHSSKYLEDASYLKMDNLSLAYDFVLKNPILKGIRLYFAAQNVFVLTPYKGVDPEVSLSGLAPGIESTSYYPRTRTFTLGAALKF